MKNLIPVATMMWFCISCSGDTGEISNNQNGADTGIDIIENDVDGETDGSQGDTGSQDVGTSETGLVFETLRFDATGSTIVNVESDDVSVLISAQTDGIDVAISEIRNPNGEVIYSLVLGDDDFNLTSDFWAYPGTGAGAASVIIPPSPRLELTAGAWTIKAITEGGPLLAGTVVRKKKDDAATHAIDLDIWFATETAPLGSTDQQQSFVDAVVPHIDAILTEHNLGTGRVSLNPETIPAGFGTIDAEEIESLCAATNAIKAPERSMRMVVVDWINFEGSPCCGGVAPAAPGTIMTTSNDATCVVVSYFAYGTSYVEHAGNFLHEAAHYLGMPHTTEQTGAQFDKYTDTPECSVDEFDTNNDGGIDDFECGVAGGADNFLFSGGVVEFTPYHATSQQAAAMRVHPLFYPVESN